MHTIQVEIPNQLAEKLAPHCDRLSELLELGLQTWLKREQKERLASRGGLLQILAASGKVTLPQLYPGERPYTRRTPVRMTGKPASELVIEQRGPLQ